MRSWVKTTGGRGHYVVVPLKPKRTSAECLDFSRAVSEAIVRADSRVYTTAFAKSGREHKILIHYLRNNRTNTSVCAFSPQARPGATVSMPLGWNELIESPRRWTMLRRYRDGALGSERTPGPNIGTALRLFPPRRSQRSRAFRRPNGIARMLPERLRQE